MFITFTDIMRDRPSPSTVKVLASEVARGSKSKHNADNKRPVHSRESSKLGQQALRPDDIMQGYDNFKFLELLSGQYISCVRKYMSDQSRGAQPNLRVCHGAYVQMLPSSARNVKSETQTTGIAVRQLH